MALLKVTVTKHGVSPIDAIHMRSVLSIFFSLVLGAFLEVSFRVESKDRKFLILRGIFGTIGGTCSTYSIAMVPLTV